MKKNTGTSAVLNFLIPGLGFIFLGETLNGIVVFFLWLLTILWWLNSHTMGMLVIPFLIWISGIVTAATYYNSKTDTDKTESL